MSTSTHELVSTWCHISLKNNLQQNYMVQKGNNFYKHSTLTTQKLNGFIMVVARFIVLLASSWTTLNSLVVNAFVQPSSSFTSARLFASLNGDNKINGGEEAAPTVGTVSSDDPYSFVVPVLGDLHIDPRKMEDYEVGREHIKKIIQDAKSKLKRDDGVAIVSLGDLGESKNCDHNEDNPFELFAGTTKCHEMAAEFLGSFGDNVPYEVIGGNHDLEGKFPARMLLVCCKKMSTQV